MYSQGAVVKKTLLLNHALGGAVGVLLTWAAAGKWA